MKTYLLLGMTFLAGYSIAGMFMVGYFILRYNDPFYDILYTLSSDVLTDYIGLLYFAAVAKGVLPLLRIGKYRYHKITRQIGRLAAF